MAKLGLGAFSAATLIWVGGCTLFSSLDGLEGGPASHTGGAGGVPTGGAGGSDVGAGGSGGDDPGPGDECVLPDECAPPTSRCIDVTCNDGLCGYVSVGNLVPIQSQVEGDCQAIVCDGTGGELRISTLNDLPDDGNACTEDICDDTGPANTALVGEACNTGFCNAAGDCVECLVTGDCVGTDECLSELCVPASCDDALQNGDETAFNCGGSCPPCADGLSCLVAADCISGVCNGTCQAPACDDLVRNGAETGVDCGAGGCPLCGTAQECDGAQNCLSGVCFLGECQAPACDDSVLNGSESDVDCGGTCPRCGPGRGCTDADDCAVGLQCIAGKCADPCEDQVKNYQETDVDCGGPLCDPCPAGRVCDLDRDCQSGNCCTSTQPNQCGTKTVCPIMQ